MRVAIAGNYSLDPSRVAMHLLRQLAELPIDSAVLMRSPLSGQPGPVERVAEQLCRDLSIPVEWRVPVPGSGGEGTIDRDMRMVEDSDAVIVYFHPDHVMSEERGTTRLARHAISLSKPVQAFSAGEDETVWVGSIEEGLHA
jgi:hypothetical protein